MEFSKKTTIVSWSVALTLTALAIILPIAGIPYDGVLTALPYSWMEVAVDHAFYKWKAKNENRRKYAMYFVEKIAKEYNIDYAVRFAEVVLKE